MIHPCFVYILYNDWREYSYLWRACVVWLCMHEWCCCLKLNGMWFFISWWLDSKRMTAEMKLLQFHCYFERCSIENVCCIAENLCWSFWQLNFFPTSIKSWPPNSLVYLITLMWKMSRCLRLIAHEMTRSYRILWLYGSCRICLLICTGDCECSGFLCSSQSGGTVCISKCIRSKISAAETALDGLILGVLYNWFSSLALLSSQ